MSARITKAQLQQGFSGDVLSPGDDRYEERLARFYSRTTVERTGCPRLILAPKTTEDVSLALRLIDANNQPKDDVSIISGGYGVRLNCGTGLLFDMNMHMRKVEIIDLGHHQAKSGKGFKIAGGAIWEDVVTVGLEKGLTSPGAKVSCKGVVGSATVGGYGFSFGQHGLAVDNIVEVELVLADGKIVKANEKDNKDLFWAVRGAGPSFGCITSVTLIAHEQKNENVFWATLLYPRNKTAEVAQAAREWHQKADEREAVTITICQPDPNQEVFIKAHLFFNSDANPDESINRFSTFLNAGPAQVDKGLKRLDELHRDMCQVMPGADDDMNTSRRIAQSGGICSALYQRNFEGAVDAFSKLVKSEPDFKDSIVIVELYPKRKVHHSDRDYSFVGTNDRIHNSLIILSYTQADKDKLAQSTARSISEVFKLFDESPGDLVDAPRYPGYTIDITAKEAFGRNLERLRKIKAMYDHKDVFGSQGKWINIEPAQ